MTYKNFKGHNFEITEFNYKCSICKTKVVFLTASHPEHFYYYGRPYRDIIITHLNDMISCNDVVVKDIIE